MSFGERSPGELFIFLQTAQRVLRRRLVNTVEWRERKHNMAT
jgi:hypothetical protein